MRRFFAVMYVKHARRLAALRNVPLLGKLVHYAGLKAMPSDFRVWRQVHEGEGAGLWMDVNPRTAAELCAGQSEVMIQKSLAEHLRPGMTFYDVGANIGFFTLIGARLVGETGRVFSFEPDREIAARLRENAARNGFGWVSVFEAAVYSHGGQIQFGRAEPSQSPDRGTGRVLAGEASADAAASGDSVRSIVLDDFLQENPAPQVVKCDVEGAEIEALRGARNMLKQHRPVIICEIHSAECEAGVRQILREHAYSIERLDGNHLLGKPVF